MDENELIKNIHTHYPEGLTVIYNVDSTRTFYMLENRHASDPGKVDISNYTKLVWEATFMKVAKNFYELGGQNLILYGLGPTVFRRGLKYVELTVKSIYETTISNNMRCFYQENNINPYFPGIEKWLHPSLHPSLQEYTQQAIEFQKNWPYSPQPNKLIMDMWYPAICNFWDDSYQHINSEEEKFLDAKLKTLTCSNDIDQFLYTHYLNKIDKIGIPLIHGFISDFPRGYLKFQVGKSYYPHSRCLKLYYVPYPFLYLSRESLKAILEDLVTTDTFDLTLDQLKSYTPESLQKKYEHFKRLAADPQSVWGLAHQFVQKV